MQDEKKRDKPFHRIGAKKKESLNLDFNGNPNLLK